MEVLAYDRVLLNGAIFMVDSSRLLLLFVRDIVSKFTSLRGTGGSIDLLGASVLIALVFGGGYGYR